MGGELAERLLARKGGHAVMLRVANEVCDVLTRACDGAVALHRFGSPEQLFVAMEHARFQADAMLLGVGLEQPVRVVQRIHSFGLDVPVLVMTEPARNEQLSQALKFAPFIGRDVSSWCCDSLESLPKVLTAAVTRTRKRRQFKGSIAEAQRNLGKLRSDRPPVSHYFERLLDRAPMGVVNVDVHGTILSLNRYACQVLGISEREALGTAFRGYLPENEHPRLRDILARCVAPMRAKRPEILEVRPKGGSARHAEVIASSLVDRTGQLGATVFLQDVTDKVWEERKRLKAEEALRSSEARYRELIQTMSEALAMTDKDYRITFVNRSFCDMFGYTVKETVRRPLLEFVHPDDRAMMAERMAARGEDAAERFETTWVARDGRVIHTLTSPRTFVDGDGRFAGCLGVFTDITERKRVEQWERAHLQELAHVSRITTIGQMSSQIAHELAQPLTAIGGMSAALLKLLRAQAVSEKDTHETLSEISIQADRARDIIIRLRDFVRNEELRRADIDINDLIRTVIRLANPRLQNGRLEMGLDLTEGLPPVLGDRVLIEQVLLNLVRNALEAMEGDPGRSHRVAVCSAPHGEDELEVLVSDTGPGLGKEFMDELFQPFFTTKAEGMGMGLAITRSVINAHGGRIWAEPNPGGGAVFRFTLPLTSAKDRET